MIKKNLLIIFLTIFFSFTLSFGKDANEILRTSDNLLFPKEVYVTQTMTIYKKHLDPFVTKSEIYIKGLDKLLILNKYPKELNGSGQLILENDYWSYNANIKKMYHISAKEPILGSDFTIFDITRNKLHHDYNAVLLGEETIKGVPVYKLELRANKKKLPYEKIITYINKENYLPFSREYYTKNGVLLKTLIFSDIRDYRGKPCPYKEMMINNLEEGTYTVIEYEKIDERNIDDKMFTTSFLKFKGN